VGRAKCYDPPPGEVIPVYVMRAVRDPHRALSLAELMPDDELLKAVHEYLDERRIVGARVHVGAVRLRGVTAVVDVEVSAGAHAETVQGRIERALYGYLNPLVGGGEDAEEGWEFGRPVVEGELTALVRALAGVHRVHWVRMYETDLETPGTPNPRPAGARIELAQDELVCSAAHRVRARHRSGR
jgi:hypothetical protein